MIQHRGVLLATLLLTLTVAATVVAQFGRGSRMGRRPPATPNRSAYPMWRIEPSFQQDVFTFARIQYDSLGYGGRGSRWDNDFPDCDWNFSYRLQQLTSIQVDPNGRVLRLMDPDLFNYPFIYMSNVGSMSLRSSEADNLRQYLLRGGFLMADDFWTPRSWRHVKKQMRQVFPKREPRELTLDHEIFHLVYDLKEIPQVPSIFAWRDGYMFEYWHGDSEGDEAPHFHGYFDDNGRLMALMCQNNDIGDGWEREGENKEFFERFSTKVSYPLGINIVTYAMTH